ncbi:MAG: two-component regulator propeller domain-containing protein, partial [Bacteroidota bacterium]
MINYSKCLLGLYLLLLPWVLAGQSYTFTAREIETDGELNNSRITAVKEDPDGFIWMTTLEGVARYDGYQVKWFTHSNSALRNIPDQRRIALDDEGYLWLIKNDQLDLLHYRTFEVISGEEKFKASFPDGLKVLDVYPTKDGGVIFWAEINDKRTFFLYHSSKGLRNLAFLEGTTRLLIKENSIWSTDNGYHFVEYDLKTGKALNQIEFPKFTITSASCLIDTPLKGDWFGVYQHQQKMAMIFRYLEGRSELMFSMPVEDDPLIFEQIFWYHAPSQLILLDFNKRKGREILALDQNLELIPLSNSQAADIEGRILYCDRQGILWTSSWGKCTLQQIRRSDIRQYGQNKSFRGLWSQDDLLLAQNVKFEKSQPTRNRVLEELGHFVCFDQTNKEECWVGGQNGIFQYDPEKESIIQQFPLKRTEKEQRFATLWSILKDAEGKWWGGLMGHGLASLLPGEDSLQFYQQYNEYPRLQSKSIIHLLEDGKYIWAASNIGLYLVDKNKGVVQKYAYDFPSPYYLPQSDVYFLHRDQQQTYWAGTNTNGLIRFQLDEQMRVTNYQQYDKDDGLPSSVIYAIIEVEKERLWLSTNNGISC